METIRSEFAADAYSSGIFDRYFGGMNIGYFDIETTGLSPSKAALVLGGIAELGGAGAGRGIATQYLAGSLPDERDVLKALISHLSRFDVIVTYNGVAFDMPFLHRRCSEAGIAHDIRPYVLDIYRIVRGFSPLRSFLPNLKQDSLESFMGLWSERQDTITGKESVDLYYEYCMHGDIDAKEKILLHNHDDICQLSRIMKVLDRCDLHRALGSMGLPVSCGEHRLIADKISAGREHLVISGVQCASPISGTLFDLGAHGGRAAFDAHKHTFEVDIPLLQHGDMLLADIDALYGQHLSEIPILQELQLIEGYLVLCRDDEYDHRCMNYLAIALLESLLQRLA